VRRCGGESGSRSSVYGGKRVESQQNSAANAAYLCSGLVLLGMFCLAVIASVAVRRAGAKTRSKTAVFFIGMLIITMSLLPFVAMLRCAALYVAEAKGHAIAHIEWQLNFWTCVSALSLAAILWVIIRSRVKAYGGGNEEGPG